MLIGRALSGASCSSFAALDFLVDFDFFFGIFFSWKFVEIQTHKRMRKANFDEKRASWRKWHLNDRCVHFQQSGSDERREVTVRGRIKPPLAKTFMFID